MRRRVFLAGAAALPSAARAAAVLAPPNLALRQTGGRPLWQPVTNRNGTNGTQGTTGSSNPDTLSRVTKTMQTSASHLRTVLMGFQMNPFEQPLVGNNAGVTGAYACTGASVAAGGTGYTAGTVLVFSKGTAAMTATVLIVTRVAAGIIAQVKVADPGA